MIIFNNDEIKPITFTAKGKKYSVFNDGEYYFINDLVSLNKAVSALPVNSLATWSIRRLQKWLMYYDKQFVLDYIEEVAPLVVDGVFEDFKTKVLNLSKIKRDYYADDEENVPYWAR